MKEAADLKEKNRRGSLRAWWMSLSIRYKVGIFLGMVVAMVLLLCISTLGMTYLHMQDFNEILGDSYAVSRALGSFEGERQAFIAYSGSFTEENSQRHQAARLEAAESMADLRLDYLKTSTDRYLLAQAAQNAYASYTASCNRLLQAAQKDIAYISEYYETLDTAAYINSYLQDLMRYTLAEGTEQYDQKTQALRILPIAGNSIGALIVLFAALFGTVTIRYIIMPVLQLARDAGRISENCLDFPDMQVNNRDEIGQLVETFNRMKHSMRSHIQSLEEYRRMENRLHQEELQRIATEQEMRDMQLSMLQSQINPHFLFNTLNTIRSTAKIEGAKNTEEIIQRLANLFRYNLYTADERVPLERELNIIQDYIYIQKRRFGHRLAFELDCRINISRITVPTFTLQPLVENSIIHGIAPQEEGGSVRLSIRRRNRRIVITIVDNGMGFASEQMEKLLLEESSQRGHVSHIGLGNVRTRLALLYPGSEFKMFSRVGLGTVVRLTLPVPADLEE